MTLTLYDEFAGWGGSSQGSTAVPGVELALAANHAPIAVDVHALNFPDADHYLGDVAKADITRFPRADLFWASPSCPPFSNGRGEKQYFDDATKLALFDDPTESPEDRAKRLDLVKRRALMEEVPRYLRAMAERGAPVVAGVVENVPQARRWDEHDRWRREIEAIGPYRTRLIALNAMHAQSVRTRRAPQSRDRYFLAYWLESLGRDPDWDRWLRPQAWCPTCDRWVRAVQVWKRPGMDMGSYGRGGQYVYRCPSVTCRQSVVDPAVLPAAAAIDWDLPPGERIGDRARPLQPATLARIEAGLRKYCRPGVVPPMLVPAGGTWRGDAASIEEVMRTRTTRESDGLLIPTTARDGQAPYSTADPLRTQTTRLETALVQVPYWVLLRGGGSRDDGGAYGMDDPFTTFSAAGQHHALIHPPAFVMRNNSSRGDGSEMSTPVDEPLRTLTTRGHQSLITLMLPYYSQSAARPTTEPIGTLTTRDRYAVVQASEPPAVEDCTFRMLDPLEIAAGMAFAPDYKVIGTKREQTAGYGNAVCPPCAEVIMSALVEAITGEDVAACSA